MAFDVQDTIVAVASPPGGSIRGIIRISGDQTLDCLQKAFEFEDRFEPSSLAHRCVRRCDLKLGTQSRLPGSLLVWPNRRSYTRQPSAEFHTFGSPPLLQAATEAICRSGARLAERGEFTLRAFLSGRIDLTQAEAVLAVIDSKAQSQLDNALRQLSGGLSGPLAEMRNSLIGVLAELEAGLDFVEEDIEFISKEELESSLVNTSAKLIKINEQLRNRNLNEEKCTVVLMGPPNVGKSSLFNALLGDDKAIVASIEGTTRDFVSANRTWDDCEIQLIDTAGIDQVRSQSERFGIDSQAQAQTQKMFERADIALLCFDKLASDNQQSQLSETIERLDAQSYIVVLTKVDLSPERATDLDQQMSHKLSRPGQHIPVVETSIHQAAGIEQLRAAIVSLYKRRQQFEGAIVSATATRAAASLDSAAKSIELAIQAVRENLGLEVVAAELRQVLHDLGTVIGTVYTDDILDQIFGRFCIGK